MFHIHGGQIRRIVYYLPVHSRCRTCGDNCILRFLFDDNNASYLISNNTDMKIKKKIDSAGDFIYYLGNRLITEEQFGGMMKLITKKTIDPVERGLRLIAQASVPQAQHVDFYESVQELIESFESIQSTEFKGWVWGGIRYYLFWGVYGVWCKTPSLKFIQDDDLNSLLIWRTICTLRKQSRESVLSAVTKAHGPIESLTPTMRFILSRAAISFNNNGIMDRSLMFGNLPEDKWALRPDDSVLKIAGYLTGNGPYIESLVNSNNYVLDSKTVLYAEGVGIKRHTDSHGCGKGEKGDQPARGWRRTLPEQIRHSTSCKNIVDKIYSSRQMSMGQTIGHTSGLGGVFKIQQNPRELPKGANLLDGFMAGTTATIFFNPEMIHEVTPVEPDPSNPDVGAVRISTVAFLHNRDHYAIGLKTNEVNKTRNVDLLCKEKIDCCPWHSTPEMNIQRLNDNNVNPFPIMTTRMRNACLKKLTKKMTIEGF